MTNECEALKLYDDVCVILRVECPPLLEVTSLSRFASGVRWDSTGAPTVTVDADLLASLDRQALIAIFCREIARALLGPRDPGGVRFHALCHLFFRSCALRYSDWDQLNFHETGYSWLSRALGSGLVGRIQAAAWAAAGGFASINRTQLTAEELAASLQAPVGLQGWILGLADPRTLFETGKLFAFCLVLAAGVCAVADGPWLALGLLCAGAVAAGINYCLDAAWRLHVERAGPRLLVIGQQQ